MDQPRVSSKRHSRHQEIPQPPVVTQEYEVDHSIKLIDILPLVLCLGIIVLLYFIVRELQSEQENQETRYASLLKRLETMEKKADTQVPEAANKKEGTYVLKNSVVSFKPEDGDAEDDDAEDDDEDTVELPETPDAIDPGSESDSEDGEFS